MNSNDAALILAVGNDALLLLTRAAVLRVAGFQVIVAQSSDQAADGWIAGQRMRDRGL